MLKALSSSAIGNVYFPAHMRCLTNGNYDPIQCVTRNKETELEDKCFCVNDDLKLNGSLTFQSLTTDLKASLLITSALVATSADDIVFP